MSETRPLAVTVVVPARNAQNWIEPCLKAIRRNRPAEIILIDGCSRDATVQLARPYVDRVLDDEGAGVAAARQLGARAASRPWIAFVDADVVLSDNTLRDLTLETLQRRLVGIQAGLRSVGEGDYWSEQLARHHNSGRSREWFGVSASLIEREVILQHGFDLRFSSGEDIDLRLRLRQAEAPVGVSRTTIVRHRFGGGFHFARDQWLADGAGLGRLVRKHGRPAMVSAATPFAAAILGLAGALRHGLRPVPYWAGFAAGNFIGLLRGLADSNIPMPRTRSALLCASAFLVLAAVIVAGMALDIPATLGLQRALQGVDSAPTSRTIVACAVVLVMVTQVLAGAERMRRRWWFRGARAAVAVAGAVALAIASVRLLSVITQGA